MGLKELKEELNNDVHSIISNEFDVEVTETRIVPTLDSQGITYPNLDTQTIKAKQIKTCVLYIDMRKSTELNLKHKPKTVTKLYAAFMRAMVKAAQYYGGKVRNIIGDRVMIVFDEENCHTDAIQTAILLNSVGLYIINKHFTHNDISFGIGVDYGRMLVSKGGIRKNGEDNAPYKSLVWLGRPANVASKLTDLANKEIEIKNKVKSEFILANEGVGMPRTRKSISDFMKNDLLNYSGWESFEAASSQPAFYCQKPSMKFYYIEEEIIETITTLKTPSILITETVYLAYKKANPNHSSIKENHWKEQDSNLYYEQSIYGSSLIYSSIQN
ncbi:adenylate/guanylate cyclase domain-containing protein [Planococcus sp. CPCC 101016]|uniref:adenylate/guanylate cyclase domain-containing protein n=1 Tax=Planococcus sp. CPCC 101016 TaxID=2599617 RepID=UPI0016495E99|nr:adenylate/guanylate cyclase domain-containing protein [Planococcus sp. CPCC 101016]